MTPALPTSTSRSPARVSTAPSSRLVAEPGAIDFGLVEIGTTGQQQLLLINEGGGDVTIESATLEGSSAFSVPDLSGTDIYGNNEKLVLVEYRPTDDSGDNATLTLETNDPTNPTLEIFMLGNGGGDFQYPDADINCPDRVNPPTAVPLDGRGSTDPMNPGGELQYDWSVLSAPPGSSTTDVLDPGKAYKPVRRPRRLLDGPAHRRKLRRPPVRPQSATSTRFHPKLCTSSSSGTPELRPRPAPGSGRLRDVPAPR